MGRRVRGMKTGFACASLALALLITGCGGSEHVADRQAWGSELKRQGVTVSDWAKYESAIKYFCDRSTDELALALTLKGAGPQSVMETGFKYECPSQRSKLDDAYRRVSDTQSSADSACATPKGERTEEQEQLAEALDC